MNIFSGLKASKVIFEADSKYNGHIEVIETGAIRRIMVDKIYQSISPNSLNTPKLYWGKVVHVLKENLPQVGKILLLGLGGGTLVHLLAKQFPGVAITSVEIDQTMVDIANNYFDLATVPNSRIIVEDAMRVIIEPETFDIHEHEFDAVIVDIYNGEKYPDLGKSGNFIGALDNLIAPGGMVLFNRIYTEHHQEEVNIFIDYVSEFFKDVQSKVVAGHTNSDNVLIYAKV